MTCTAVTVQRSYNYGSFLQAYALATTLRERFGKPVEFAEFGARSISQQGFRRVLGHIKRGNFSNVPFELSKMRALDKELACLEETPLKRSYAPDDLLLFGSDEIWNLKRSEFSKYPQFWGENLTSGNRAAYAVSANGALDDKKNIPEGFKRSIRSFDLLSARDLSTKSALEVLSGRDVELVCDPTLLLDCDYYRTVQEPTTLSGDYILVYSYGLRIPKEAVAKIVSYAHANGLTLVSPGFCLDWCDKCLPVSAFGFLGLMDSAQAVVTDTFHGTLFSTIYRKRFVSFSGGAEKVRDHLVRGGLSDRDGSFENPVAILGVEPDYRVFNETSADLVASSNDYLKRCLVLIEEH